MILKFSKAEVVKIRVKGSLQRKCCNLALRASFSTLSTHRIGFCVDCAASVLNFSFLNLFVIELLISDAILFSSSSAIFSTPFIALKLKNKIS